MNDFKNRLLNLLLALALAFVFVLPSFAVAEDGEPSVFVTLKDGAVVKSNYKSFDVYAKDSAGNKLTPTVLLNGEPVFPYDDQAPDKTAYAVTFEKEGANVFEISATDEGGKTTTVKLTVNYAKPHEGDDLGKALWTVELFTLGAGYLIAPTEVDIRYGESAQGALLRLLAANGLRCVYSEDYGFYLAYLTSGDYDLGSFGKYKSSPVPQEAQKIAFKVNIPQNLADLVDKRSDYFNPNELDGSQDLLGQLQISNGSGWMYCVNNEFPGTTFANYYLADGDVVRVQFTLAYGADIGDYGSYFDKVDRDGATKAVFAANKLGALRSRVQEQYDQTLTALATFGVSQSTLDDKAAALLKAIGELSDEVALQVANEIASLGEVSLQDEARVKQIRKNYDDLTAEQQAQVSNYDVLLAAEKRIAQLAEQADSKAAGEVVAAIEAVGEVSLQSKPAVLAARAAYDALSTKQQAQVSNYDVLLAAEKRLAELAEQDEAAQAVQQSIVSLGEITLQSKSAVQAARAAYDALTEFGKSQVAAYDVLLDAEKRLQALEGDVVAVLQNAVKNLANATTLAEKYQEIVQALTALAAVGDEFVSSDVVVVARAEIYAEIRAYNQAAQRLNAVNI